MPGIKNFYFLDTLFSLNHYLPCYYGVFPQNENFSNMFLDLFKPLKKNFSFISRTNYIINLLNLYFLEKWFSKVIWPYLNYNPFKNLFKNPTKIWRCHVMFLNHFYTKISFIHVIFWALHQFSFSGPECNFALQPF